MFMHLSDDALSIRRERDICSGSHLRYVRKSFPLSQLSCLTCLYLNIPLKDVSHRVSRYIANLNYLIVISSKNVN